MIAKAQITRTSPTSLVMKKILIAILFLIPSWTFANEFSLLICEPVIDSVSMIEPTDCSNTDGQLIIHATAGSGLYEYSIDEGASWQTDSIFIDLGTGSYIVKVRNEDGSCEVTYSEPVTLEGPGSPRFLTVTATDVTDCGADDGTIVINVTDGIEPYQYSIDDAQTWSLSNTFTGLAAGTYMAWVRNGDETCPIEYILPIEITEPVSPQIDDIALEQISDCEESDGTITVTASEGEGALQYSIDQGITWQTGNIFAGLSEGNYVVWVSNESGNCIVESNANSLSEPPAPTISQVEYTDPTDCETSDGTITVTATDGTGNYQYSIDNGTTWSDSNLFTGLAQGSYDVVVMNAEGTCSVPYNTNVILTEPIQPVITSVDVFQITDCDVTDGAITITSGFNSGDIVYSIDNGITWQTSPEFTGLDAGTYNAAVQNTSGSCFVSHDLPVEITAPLPPENPVSVVTQISDCGITDGTIEISVANGSGSYSYSIDDGVTWQAEAVFTGLSAGVYSILVSNADGSCITEVTGETQIDELTQPEVTSVSTSNPTDCNLNNGSIEVNLENGTGSYQYSIDGGLTWQTDSNVFSGLAPGTYEISIGNSDGTCVSLDVESTTITALPEISFTDVASTDITDCGETDGTISISATGGSGDYSYSIDGGTNWQASPEFTGLTAGSYIVQVQNTDGTCTTEYVPVEITTPLQPSVNNVSSEDPTDCEGSDGTITVSPAGGNPPYSYSIDGGVTWQSADTFTGLTAGAYSIVVSNGNGTCITEGDVSVNLNDPVPPVISDVSQNNPVDCESATGSINVDAVAGTDPVSYSIDGGQTWSDSGNFSELPAGSYNIAIQNNSGSCGIITYHTEITLSDPPAPQITDVFVTDADDCNSDNGEISFTVTGGTGEYQYSINDGYTWQSSPVFTELNDGTYYVAVSNADQTCEVSYNLPVTVGAPAPPVQPTIYRTHITECGEEDGTINFTGSPDTEYSIDGGITWGTQTEFLGLSAGLYDVIARNSDMTCETFFQTIEILSPPQPSINSVFPTNPSDCGVNDGQIVISVSSTTPGDLEQYSIDGGLTFLNGNTFTDLAPGSYEIVVRNSQGSCEVSYPETVILEGNDYAQITNVAEFNPTDCENADGSIVIETDQTDLIYSIDGGTTWSSESSFTGLVAGDYSVLIAYPNGSCEVSYTQEISLDEPPTPEITGVDIENSTSCEEDSADGFINITATGEGFVLEYSIDGGNTWTDNGSFTSLNAGAYDVVIRNGSNPTCTEDYETTIYLTAPDTPQITALDSVNPSDCDADDGTIMITTAATDTGLEFSIDGINWQSGNSFSGLAGGTYQVSVRHIGEECITDGVVNLTEPTAAIISDVSATDPTDCFSSDGTITVNAQNQTGQIEYSIDGGQSWSTQSQFTQLSAGEYEVQVRNTDGTCYDAVGQFVELNGLEGPEVVAVNVTESDDCTQNTADIEILTADSTNPYQYSIDGGFTWLDNNIFTGLSVGTYQVAVRNDNGSCEYSYDETIEVEAVALPDINEVTFTNLTDCATDDGTITISSVAENAEYSIDGGVTWSVSGEFSNLAEGAYSVQVRFSDAVCAAEYENSIDLSSPDSPEISEVIVNQITDCDNPSGSIQIETIQDAQFSIDGGITWSAAGIFSDLTAGIYEINISNPNGSCITSYTDPVEITEPIQPEIQSISAISSTECDVVEGSITIEASGADAYSVDGGLTWQSENIFTNLGAGSYTVLVSSDESGCQEQASEEIILTELESPEISEVNSTNPTGCGSADGTIEINAVSASSYSIDGGANWQSDNIFTNLGSGSYIISVLSDESECETLGEAAVTLSEPDAPVFTEVTANSPTECGNDNGMITVTADGADSYSIDNGQTWQSESIFSNLAVGTYEVLISAGDAGCTAAYDEVVILEAPSAPVITEVTSTDPTECEGQDGTINIQTTESGTEFSIDGGLTWETNGEFTNLSAGSYNVLVADPVSACLTEYSELIVLTAPDAVVFTEVTFTDPTQCNSEDGNITIETDCIGCEYSIDGGGTWADNGNFVNLPAGEYAVWVRTFVGDCYAEYEQPIILSDAETAVISAVSSTDPTSCTTDNGSISVSATSTGTLTFSIDGGVSWQTSGEFTDLSDGIYEVLVAVENTDCVTEYTESVVLVQPDAPLIAEVISTDVTGCTESNGTLTVNASGENLEYSIDGGSVWQTTETFINLSAGQYAVTVRSTVDGCETEYTESVIISETSDMEVTVLNVSQPSCYGEDNGLIQIAVSGGLETYNFAWSNGTSEQNPADLQAGTYSVTVTDAADCEEIIAIEIEEPAAFEISLSDTDSLILCLGQTADYELSTANGEIYEWNGTDNFYSTDAAVSINQEGQFWVTGINADGCSTQDTVNVTYTENVFDAEFLLPSQGLINTQVVAVDISWPIPDQIEWIYNQDSVSHVRSDLNQEIVTFPYEGNYTIQMQAWSGECTALIDHEITIVSDPEDLDNEIIADDNSTVREFNLFPNPNAGAFSVRIVQDAEEALTLYLFDNDGNLIEERPLDGDTSFLEDYDIQNLQPGLYMMILQTPLEWIYFNFVKQ